MDLKKMASKMLASKLDGGADAGAAESALENLTGGGLDPAALTGLADKFKNAGMADAAKSWLGDGDNQLISAEQVTAALGSDQIAAFAAKLGVDKDKAAESLADILPSLIDKSSRGGELFDAVGGFKSLGGIASKFQK